MFLSRGLLRSNSLEMFLTSVDTVVKVRNTVNTKRTGPSPTNLSLPISERMYAFPVSVASSALWLSGCWTHAKTLSSKLGSCPARLLCRMVSCRRRPDETPVDHWRRSHRTGHALAEQFGLVLPQLLSVAKNTASLVTLRDQSQTPWPTGRSRLAIWHGGAMRRQQTLN